MQKKILMSGALLGALAVGIGAFGAHGLKPLLTEYGRLDTFETGVKYHFYHSLALILIGLLQFHIKSKKLEWAGILMIAGIFIFSGSLYVLCLTNIGILGAITPIGGVGFIVGWLMLLFAVSKEL
ncbi:DUF423 domain-containing protein [Limibacter armeniacum]|uniref:DUF423 domain-containing protein n=1 Tax=Limibacter armeniacum TaxID=466084 RepID=UPI002FE64F4C